METKKVLRVQSLKERMPEEWDLQTVMDVILHYVAHEYDEAHRTTELYHCINEVLGMIEPSIREMESTLIWNEFCVTSYTAMLSNPAIVDREALYCNITKRKQSSIELRAELEVYMLQHAYFQDIWRLLSWYKYQKAVESLCHYKDLI